MGNEAYKQGRFSEALALYERAIAIDSNKATYHCNKSAALIGLGRFKDAIVECEEAIRIEPCYARAHSRLATIYFRYSIIINNLTRLCSILHGLVLNVTMINVESPCWNIYDLKLSL
jgi:DnaJ family protein C protein 7